MSRSNPQEHLQNPSTRWFEWNGELGVVRYYDKDTKKNVDLPLPFTFILLDEVASVSGWEDASNSRIYSNEVRDTAQEILVVKSSKGGVIAEGKYKDIKDRVNLAGGAYTANCYIAFKEGTDYATGSLRIKGAALGAWMDFRKANRAALYKKAVRIVSFTEGQKGRVVFRVPEMSLQNVSPEAEARAVALDKDLQEFLTVYLKRNKRDQAEAVAVAAAAAEPAPHHVRDEDMDRDPLPSTVVTDDDIPF